MAEVLSALLTALLVAGAVAAIGAFVVAPFVVCWQKGRKTMFWLSFLGIIVPFIGVLHWIGALRLARPDSRWAQNRYGAHKLARAMARFGVPGRIAASEAQLAELPA